MPEGLPKGRGGVKLFSDERELRETVSDSIRTLARRCDLNQGRLARAIDLSQSRLSKIYTCASPMPLWSLCRAADLSGGTPNDLLGIPGQMEHFMRGSMTHRLIRAWAKMTDEQQVKFLDFGEGMIYASE